MGQLCCGGIWKGHKFNFGHVRFEVAIRKSSSHISYEISYFKSGLETPTCESFLPGETEVLGMNHLGREKRLGVGGGLGLRP